MIQSASPSSSKSKNLDDPSEPSVGAFTDFLNFNEHRDSDDKEDVEQLFDYSYNKKQYKEFNQDAYNLLEDIEKKNVEELTKRGYSIFTSGNSTNRKTQGTKSIHEETKVKALNKVLKSDRTSYIDLKMTTDEKMKARGQVKDYLTDGVQEIITDK